MEVEKSAWDVLLVLARCCTVLVRKFVAFTKSARMYHVKRYSASMTMKAVCRVCLSGVQPKYSAALFSNVGLQHE